MFVPRRLWGARRRRRHPGTLDPAHVRGLALHWPAMAKPIRGRAAVSAALRSWQTYHMDTHGWSDIAYQCAIDQDGHRYALRGLRRVSAANGSTTVNRQYGAVLLILAPGEQPTPKMIRTAKRVVRRHRRLFPRSTELVGHGDIRPGGPTDCPGAVVRHHLLKGTFLP